MKIELKLPVDILVDIERAIIILQKAECNEIYLFGSLIEGDYTEDSDIDIAVKGLSKDKFFKVYGELLESLERSIDLVGLDYQNEFSMLLKNTGKIKRVA